MTDLKRSMGKWLARVRPRLGRIGALLPGLALVPLLLAQVPVLAGESAAPLHGHLTSTGSDTLANVMTLWAEQFKRQHPRVNLQIQAAGSSTAPPALTLGNAQLAPMSRAMNVAELAAFERRHGYAPTAVRIAIDGLAVYVQRDNPLPGLTLAQLDGLFGAGQGCNSGPALRTWGELGVDGAWSDRAISLYGRNPLSGTYAFFRQRVLCGAPFDDAVSELSGSAMVVQAVATAAGGIGYSGIGYRRGDVRALPLAEHVSGPFIAPGATGYPLARPLYVYVDKPPGRPLAPLVGEFLRLALSPFGQQTVAEVGFFPLTAEQVAQELRVLQDAQSTNEANTRAWRTGPMVFE